MTMPKTPRYIAFPTGAGNAAARRAGEYIVPAPRSYLSAAHAQLANPTGKLYVCTLDEAADRLDVEAAADVYPVTLQEFRVPGIGASAEGAYVLRDFGPKAPNDDRWVVHFRNDQLGGYSGGNYCRTLARALEVFREKVEGELRRAELRAKDMEPAEA
jgi:hypothetical protein